MAVVGSLPCLKVLKLLNYACDGGTWETGDEEFPLLNVLHIEESYLQIWTTQSNPFPTLKHLVLRSCQLLTEIPEEIGEISTLELIEVDNCTNCLVESAKKIKADQESFGNDALQLRASHEVQLFFEGMALSTESEAQPKGTTWKTGLIAGQGNGGIFSVEDYAALLSLAQATNLSGTRDYSLFSSDAKEKIRLIHNFVNSLLFYPEKVIPWAGRIRGLAYETEDIIDVFAWQQMQSRYRVMIPSRVKLEEQLIDVTQEIGLIAGEVVEEQPAYLLPPSSSSWFGTASNDAVVGLDEDIVAIKNRLCEESFNLQVIPIVGMGGIGKSTLARSVYEDQSIIETFRIRAWVVVSQDYSQHKFWETLLGSINSFERERVSRYKTHTSENANRVHQILMGRRYLVVMDDVWNTKVFDDVMHMFPDENNGSRIILTTRQLDVASYTDSAGPVHQMQLMKDFQSFYLLKQKVFCPIRLEGVGWEIAYRCAGLPLAVVLVAGVLSVVDPTRDSWKEVAGNMAYDVERASEEILSMSYMRLPHHLRPCFLYMGGFPKDEGHIHAPTLIKLWVAEGFLRLENGCRKSLEEEGEEYLEGLVNRNLVMVNSRKIDGKIKSCSLHDLIRDFCISKAGQEQFLHVLDGRDSPHRVEGRRISLIHSTIEGIVCPEARTVLSFQPLNSDLSWQLFLHSSRLLKVLTAVASSPEELFQFPPNTFQLFHLRYLALIGSCGIPSAVSNLANLQTLIVRPAFHRGRMYRNLRAYERETYPFSLVLEIWRMQQLRHLILHYPCVLSHPHASDPPLENLQTLLHVENLEWNEKIVQMIPNIKTLGLVYTTSQYYSLHHLDGLLQLEKLQLTGSMQFFWMRYDRILSRTLKRLTLLKCEHPWEDMWTIGSSLPNLEVLRLLDHASNGTTWETRGDEFSKLELLVIDESSLEDWITHGSHLPRLERLVIRSCRFLRKIPEGIGDIPTLKTH